MVLRFSATAIGRLKVCVSKLSRSRVAPLVDPLWLAPSGHVLPIEVQLSSVVASGDSYPLQVLQACCRLLISLTRILTLLT
jgi:hypothetical protein